MGAAAEHVFQSKYAAPALKRAMEELAAEREQPVASFDGMTMGQAFHLACDAYGTDLPEFWIIWNDWNTAPDDPQPMGDL